MSEFSGFESKNDDFGLPTLDTSRFREVLNESEIEKLTIDTIPSDIIDKIYHTSKSGVPRELDLDQFYLVRDKSNTQTLIQVLYDQDEFRRKHWTDVLFIDLSTLDDETTKVGKGQLHLARDFNGNYKDAMVAMTNTEISNARQGLGKRRLFIMNAFARSFADIPLGNGFSNSDALRMWESLVKDGLAVELPPREGYDPDDEYSRAFQFVDLDKQD